MSKELETVATAYEPCDCGYHIRHNNGGNYHSRWYLNFDKKQGCFTFMDASTCELVDYEDEPINENQLQGTLEDFQKMEREGWTVEIDWDLIDKFKNLDIEKIRKRTRDLLNKTSKKEDVLTCAAVLGAKLF